MDGRSIAGLLGSLVVVALAVGGATTFTRNFLVAVSPGAQVGGTVAMVAVVVAVVGGLSVLGGKSRRWRENPYW